MGLGGEVKRRARLAVLSGQTIQTADQFVSVVSKLVDRILLVAVPKANIEQIMPQLE